MKAWGAVAAAVVGVAALLGLALGGGRKEVAKNMRETLLTRAAQHVGSVYGPADFDGFSSGMDWCGAFVLRVLHEVGLGGDLVWEIGKGFLYKLPQTKQPKPGDLVYFNRKQHHAILERIEGNDVHTIDGNQVGGQVLRRVRPLSEVGGFFSIENLIHTQPGDGDAA